MGEARSDIVFRRNIYRSPNIVGALAQVVIPLSPEQCESVCLALRGAVGDLGVTAKTQSLPTWMLLSDANGQTSSVPSTKQGLLIQTPVGHELIVDPNGFLVVLKGSYPGRDTIFELVDWMAKIIADVLPTATVTRASVLFSCNIKPPGERFQIEDYVTPRFELQGAELNNYLEFSHRVAIDLSAWLQLPVRSIVTIETDRLRGGILVSIDAHDDRVTPLDQVGDRIRFVKDVESHVFEATITDKTRDLYGVHY